MTRTPRMRSENLHHFRVGAMSIVPIDARRGALLTKRLSVSVPLWLFTCVFSGPSVSST